jgi:restriction system protein
MAQPGMVVLHDGSRYYVDIQHSGLSKFERVRGRDQWEVQQKAAAKLAQWDDLWQKKRATDEAAKTREDKKELALNRTAEARAVTDSLAKLLPDALSRNATVEWEALKDKSVFNVAKPIIQQPQVPAALAVPPMPSRTDLQYVPNFGLLDLLVASRRERKIALASSLYDEHYRKWLESKEQCEKQADTNKRLYEQMLSSWQSEVHTANQKWEAQKSEFDNMQRESNAAIDQLKLAYSRGSAEAIEAYCQLVIDKSVYPDVLPVGDRRVGYNADTRMLVVEYSLPSPDHMPRLKEVRYVQARDSLDEIALPDAAVNSLYDSVLYQIVLRTVFELLRADSVKALDAIVFNGWVEFVDKATGKHVNSCILSLQATRDEFMDINLSQVDPKTCFKKLRGVGSAKLHGLAPIAPILQLDREDKRFIAGRDVEGSLDDGVNLAAMDWEDFEHLIRQLFEQEFSESGGEVKITQASRDRGVDAVAFDPDPIRGGKIVIQAKRYTNTVDVSAVRDLYGTVMNEGATKGILVTTSDYGPEAYEFAKGKPITLLTGGNLLSLLDKHGHSARIDIREAKRILAES